MTTNFKKYFNTKLLFVLLFGCFQAANAQSGSEKDIKDTKFYDVEIIIFKNIKVPKGQEKILPTQAPSFNERYIDLSNPRSIKNAIKYGYTTPNRDELRLKGIAHKIRRSSRYKLLTHTVWRQPGLDRAEAISFKVRGGDTFNNDYSNIDNAIEPVFESNSLTSFNKSRNSKSNNASGHLANTKILSELEGKITISLARYLHAHVDLVLRIPSDNNISLNDNSLRQEPSFISTTLNNYALIEHRRMRSRKLHYLDHPEFGMLILITPYEVPQDIIFIDE